MILRRRAAPLNLNVGAEQGKLSATLIPASHQGEAVWRSAFSPLHAPSWPSPGFGHLPLHKVFSGSSSTGSIPACLPAVTTPPVCALGGKAGERWNCDSRVKVCVGQWRDGRAGKSELWDLFDCSTFLSDLNARQADLLRNPRFCEAPPPAKALMSTYDDDDIRSSQG